MNRLLTMLLLIGLVSACGGGGSSVTPPGNSGGNNPAPANLPEIVINEILASNDNGLLDEDGDSSDWIELYNPGDESINLEGWALYQSVTNRWTFPQVTLAAGEYLVVFASGKDRRPSPATVTDGVSNLHTGFQLDRSGEYLALEDDSGNLQPDGVFNPEYPIQRTDISYGFFANTLRYLENPTPGEANVGPTFVGAVEDTGFSVDRGFFTNPFEVIINSDTTTATIRYTTDGSTPTLDNGTDYTSPISISGTTTLRAAAFQEDWLPTNTDTQTYLFITDIQTQSPANEPPTEGWPDSNVNGQLIDFGMDPDVVNDVRYADLMDDALLDIPSISLVTDLAYLFDPETGIYVNAIKDGREWERPTSVELIHPDGSEGFQIDAGLRIRGGASRRDYNAKHSFRLFFRDEYGNGKLEYPLFEDEGVDRFDKIDLRTTQNYSWHIGGRANNVMLRDVVNRDIQRDMGHPYTRSRYYHLYLNGVYWGIFQTQERSEARHAEAYFGGNKDDYDVIKVDSGLTVNDEDVESFLPYTTVATDGNVDAWHRLWDAAEVGFDSDENYYRVQGLNTDRSRNTAFEHLLDVDNLIDYLLIIFYGGNLDSPVTRFGSNNVPNNMYAIYNRESPSGFKMFVHDAEHTMLLGDIHGFGDELFTNRTGPFSAGQDRDYSNPQWLHQRLVSHPEYRMRFADLAHQAFFNSGPMNPEVAEARMMARASQIDLAVIAESARWGDNSIEVPRTKDDDWLPAINDIRADWFPQRTDIVVNQIRAKNWYPNLDAPVFYLNDNYQHGGNISTGDVLTLDNPDAVGDIYYTLDGSDPRLPGDYAFTDAVVIDEDAQKRVFVPISERSLYAETGEFDVNLIESSIPMTNLDIAISLVLREPDNQNNVTNTTATQINFLNTGGSGNYGDDAPFPGTTIGVNADRFVLEVRGAVFVPSPGQWTFGVNSDDGFLLTVGGHELSHSGRRGASDTLGVFSFQEAGVYPLYLVSFEDFGGASTELFAAEGNHDEWNPGDFDLVGDTASGGLEVMGTAWNRDHFDDSAWTVGTGGIGYETDNNCSESDTCYTEFFDIELEDEMYETMSTVFVRIPFEVAGTDLTDASHLTLNMRFEDGFVAYLNGAEIARANAPASILWNSTATNVNGDNQARSIQEFPVEDGVGLLKQGGNLLAIQGLNVATSSSDFLMSSELVINRMVGHATVATTALLYDGGSINLSETTTVSARVLLNGEWSALNQGTYSID